MAEFDIKDFTPESGIELVNLTEHPIVLAPSAGGRLVIEAEGVPARRTETLRSSEPLEIAGLVIPVESSILGDSKDLPGPVANRYLVVSRILAESLPGRVDLLVPGRVNRDSDGRIISVASLRRIAARSESDGFTAPRPGSASASEDFPHRARGFLTWLLRKSWLAAVLLTIGTFAATSVGGLLFERFFQDSPAPGFHTQVAWVIVGIGFLVLLLGWGFGLLQRRLLGFYQHIGFLRPEWSRHRVFSDAYLFETSALRGKGNVVLLPSEQFIVECKHTMVRDLDSIARGIGIAMATTGVSAPRVVLRFMGPHQTAFWTGSFLKKEVFTGRDVELVLITDRRDDKATAHTAEVSLRSAWQLNPNDPQQDEATRRKFKWSIVHRQAEGSPQGKIAVALVKEPDEGKRNERVDAMWRHASSRGAVRLSALLTGRIGENPDALQAVARMIVSLAGNSDSPILFYSDGPDAVSALVGAMVSSEQLWSPVPHTGGSNYGDEWSWPLALRSGDACSVCRP